MAYNFVSLGGARVKNDFSTMGIWSGASSNFFSSGMAPYVGGRSVGLLSAGTAAATGTGGTASDYLAIPMSSTTLDSMWADKIGFAMSWKQMSWIPGSVGNNIIWDGSQYVMPTVGSVGNYIGVSPDGNAWNFVLSPGSGSTSGTLGYGIGFNGEAVWVDSRGGAMVAVHGTPSVGYSATTIFTGSSSQRSSAVGNGRIAFGFDNGHVYHGTDINGPFTDLTALDVSIYTICNIPGTAVWLVAGADLRCARSPDDLQSIAAVTPNVSTDVVGIAASDVTKTVIAIGRSSSYSRSVDQGLTFTPGTFPLTGRNMGGVAYGNGTFVAASYSHAEVFVSKDDGVTWTTVATPFPTLTTYTSGFCMDGLKFINGEFWLCSPANTQNDYLLARSKDGIKWELLMSTPARASSNTGNNTNCNGLFYSQPPSTTGGSPAGYYPIGFTPNAAYTAATFIQTVAMNTTVVATTVPNGVNQWHEFQLIARPAAATNNWEITYVIDSVVVRTTTLSWSSGTAVNWFSISRGAWNQYTADMVYLEFPIAQDPGMLGPDLRVYYDVPATDDTPLEWNPSVEGAAHAEMVAQPSITNSTTSVSEQGAPKRDQYSTNGTVVPEGYRVLGVTTEAFFSRQMASAMKVTVGVSSGGVVQELTPQDVVSPVGSWTYLRQDLDKDPKTGAEWTRTSVGQAKIRIGRTT